MYLGLLLPLSSVLLVLLDTGVLEADKDEVEVEVSSIRSFEFGSEEVRAICPTKLGLLTILTFSELCSENLSTQLSVCSVSKRS